MSEHENELVRVEITPTIMVRRLELIGDAWMETGDAFPVADGTVLNVGNRQGLIWNGRLVSVDCQEDLREARELPE